MNKLFSHKFQTPIGEMVTITDQNFVYLLHYAESNILRSDFKKIESRNQAKIEKGTTFISNQLVKELHEYFAGERISFTVPIAIHGSLFQKQVWNRILKIPYGKTKTLEEVYESVSEERSLPVIKKTIEQIQLHILLPSHRLVSSHLKLVESKEESNRQKYLQKHEKETMANLLSYARQNDFA